MITLLQRAAYVPWGFKVSSKHAMLNSCLDLYQYCVLYCPKQGASLRGVAEKVKTTGIRRISFSCKNA